MTTVGVYSDERILKEKEDGHIIIEPFSEKQLNNCSYNVTLSEYFFREVTPQYIEKRGKFVETFLNPWCERHVAQRWQQGEVDVADEENWKKLGLKLGDKYISLKPFETILVATQEFIGGREHITTMVKGRSSGARSFLSVCGGAGWGDVGYINRWTLMVTNMSRFSDIILPVGCSIAQIVFLECGRPRSSYEGKYQSDVDPNKSVEELLQVLEEKWSPAMMLPQLYKEYPVEEESDEELPADKAIFEVQKHPISTESPPEL